jgi:hypothetical protein
LSLPSPTPIATSTVTPLPTPTFTAAPPACPSVPDACRTSTVPHTSKVQVNDRATDAKDRLAWQWSHGSATTRQDLGEPFGDPTTTTAYDLCVYDDGGLRAALRIPAGGFCPTPTKPCWRALPPGGFTYKNPTGLPDGVTRVVLHPGISGKAFMKLKGAGAALPLPPLASLSGTLRIQLRNRSTGLCFDTTFVPPFDKLTSEQLKDRAD